MICIRISHPLRGGAGLTNQIFHDSDSTPQQLPQTKGIVDRTGVTPWGFLTCSTHLI